MKTFHHFPVKVMNTLASLPVVGSPKLQRNTKALMRLQENYFAAMKRHEYLETADWKFINTKLFDVLDMMSPEEREIFSCDPRKIDWKDYIHKYCIGLQIYTLGQDTPNESHKLTQILMKNKNLFDDIKESFALKKNVVSVKFIKMENVINEKRYHSYIKMILEEQLESGKLEADEEKRYEILTKSNYRYDELKIKNELSRMNRIITMAPMRSLYYITHKIIDHLVQALYVDLESLKKIKAQSLHETNRIIFLPLNRSFADSIILQYINFYEDLRIGYFFASQEDHWNMRLLHSIYKYIGMFLPQRKMQHDHSIGYVNQALFEDTIINNPITTIYQNNGIERSGKISCPSEPDDSILWILRAMKNPQLERYKIKIVPVAINYERVFDSILITKEILSGKYPDMNII